MSTCEEEKEPSLQPLSFFVDPEDPLQLKIHLELDLITAQVSEALAEQSDEHMEAIYDVLDLKCGPGGWAQQVAHTYPEMKVCGIDRSSTLVRYAQSHATRLGLENLQFRVMDITQHPLSFLDSSFDLLNGKWLSRVLPEEAWPAVLAECTRLLRPGGILRLTEGEWSIVHEAAPALARLLAWCRAIPGSGAPQVRTTWLLHAVRAAGFQETHCCAEALDVSCGTPAHAGFQAYVECLFQMKRATLGQPHQGLDALASLAFSEMNQKHFSAVLYLLITWGKKPSQGNSGGA